MKEELSSDYYIINEQSDVYMDKMSEVGRSLCSFRCAAAASRMLCHSSRTEWRPTLRCADRMATGLCCGAGVHLREDGGRGDGNEAE